MQIVIDIDEHIYKQIMADSEVYILDNEVDRILIENAIYNGTPLPEGHGRLIDESQIKHIDCHTEQELYGAKIRYVKTTDAPTIIEADEGSDAE